MKLMKNLTKISSAAVRLAAGIGGAVLVFLAGQNAVNRDNSKKPDSKS